MTHEEALRMDILLELQKKGYNLIDGDKPEIMLMSLGGGYTLECNVKKPSEEWIIFFNDGVEITEYPATSVKVVFSYRKDADALRKEYNAALGIVETPVKSEPEILYPMKKTEKPAEPKKSKKSSSKKKNRENSTIGMSLPIVYPDEMQGYSMRFLQWTANNNVIPKNSKVVILDDDDYNFKITIMGACLSFDIPKTKAEIIKTEEVEA